MIMQCCRVCGKTPFAHWDWRWNGTIWFVGHLGCDCSIREIEECR